MKSERSFEDAEIERMMIEDEINPKDFRDNISHYKKIYREEMTVEMAEDMSDIKGDTVMVEKNEAAEIDKTIEKISDLTEQKTDGIHSVSYLCNTSYGENKSYLSQNQNIEDVKQGMHEIGKGLKVLFSGIWKLKMLMVGFLIGAITFVTCFSIYGVAKIIENMHNEDPVVVEMPVCVHNVNIEPKQNEENITENQEIPSP